MLPRPPRSTRFPTRRSSDLSLVIFGLHVHVAIPDAEQRIEVLNEARYFLPHLLALSTSSPFWMGRNTGLKRSEEHTSELQSHVNLVCRLLLEKKKMR